MILKNFNKVKEINGSSILVVVDDELVYNTRTDEILTVVNGKVSVVIYETPLQVSLDWIIKYANSGAYLPKGYEEYITNIDFKPYNLKSHKVNWDYIVVYKEPVYNKIYKDFRLIPMYPYLSASKEGSIIDTLTGKLRHDHKTIVNDRGWYRVISVRSKKVNTPNTTLVHRLVAMAWVPNDDYLNKPIVDHIDGDKFNCHADNLEWVSFKENNRRISEQELRSDNIDVKVKDHNTGQITIFSSMTQACEYMGRSRINRLEEFCDTPRLINGRFEIKLLKDKSKWYFDDYKGKYIIKFDNNLLAYETIKDIVKDLFPESEDLTPNKKVIAGMIAKKFPDAKIEFPEDNRTIGKDRYQVMNIETMEIKDFDNRKEIESYTGMSKSSVAKYINLGPTYSYDSWSLRKYSEDPWPDIEHNVKPKSIKVKITNISTGIETIFNSVRSAGLFLGVDKKTVLKYMDTDKICMNCKITSV